MVQLSGLGTFTVRSVFCCWLGSWFHKPGGKATGKKKKRVTIYALLMFYTLLRMSFTVCFHLLFDFIKILWSECGKEGNEGEKFTISQSVKFSCSVVSDSLWSCGLQHNRPPCLSPSPGVYSNSCPLSLWRHPTILLSVVPFFTCLQSFQHQGLFQWVSTLH